MRKFNIFVRFVINCILTFVITCGLVYLINVVASPDSGYSITSTEVIYAKFTTSILVPVAIFTEIWARILEFIIFGPEYLLKGIMYKIRHSRDDKIMAKISKRNQFNNFIRECRDESRN